MNYHLTLALTIFLALSAFAGAENAESNELAISLNPPSPISIKAAEEVQTVLSSLKADGKGLVRAEILDNSRYVLHGDLFKNCQSYALVELGIGEEQGFALCHWQAGRWELTRLWRIPTTWRPKGWKEAENDYLPTTPAEKPFWLQDFDGDGVPEVVVAGEVEKYFQVHYLLKFNRKTQQLYLLGSGYAAPVKAGKFVRFYTNSGRRSIFDEWVFDKWSGNRLDPVCSWHDEVPYNNTGSPFQEAVRFTKNGKESSTHIVESEDTSDLESRYTITKGSATATVVIRWKGLPERQTNDTVVQAYLFEKLTGLPRTLYPEKDSDTKTDPARLEKQARVTVSGSKPLVRLFSSQPWKPW